MRRPILIVTIFIASIQSVPITAQWMHTTGPHGGFVRAMVFKGTDIFAAVQGVTPWTDTYRGGLYRSTDSGLTWTSTTLKNTWIGSLAVKGERLLAATSYLGNSNMTISTDNGTTWANADSGLPSSEYFATVANVGDYLFAGGSTVYRSSDGGVFWSPAENGLPDRASYAFASNGTHVFVGTSLGVYRSVDSGASWTPASSGLMNSIIHSLLAAPDGHLFAGTARGVFSSTDSGTSWANYPAIPDTDVYAIAVNGSTLFAAVDGHGVYRSIDNGQSWALSSSGLTPLQVGPILPYGPVIFVGSSGAGIFRSSDNGTTWSASSSGLPRPSVQSMAVRPVWGRDSELYAATSGGIYRSLDHGMTWSPAGTGLTERTSCVAVDGRFLFAGTYRCGIYRSTDRGENWARADSGIDLNHEGSSVECFAMDSDGPLKGILFVGLRDYGVYRSSDSGMSWTQAGLTGKDVLALAIIDSTLIAGTLSGIYRSTDRGNSWDLASMPDTLVRSLGSMGSSLFAGTSWGVFLSLDLGGSWIPVQVWSPQQVPVGAFAFMGETVVAGTYGRGAFLSQDGGMTWVEKNHGLGEGTQHSEAMYIQALAVNGADLFAGTYDGVWRLDFNLAVREGRPSVPAEVVLEHNYPNPFNPTTTIQFALPHRTHVTLTVFNTLGQQIATLVNGEIDAGYNTVQFDGSGLASGIYLYRLQAASFVATKTLVLIR